jgi:hypothetical protein
MDRHQFETFQDADLCARCGHRAQYAGHFPVTPTHRYFVSFWWTLENGKHGFGNITAELSGPVRTPEHLTYLADLIHDQSEVPDYATVIILNLIRLDWS